MKKKKSFVMYHDSYPLLACLPNEQLGMLFRAVMECAQLESEGQDGYKVLENYPDMFSETKMAFSFLWSTLHRDCQTYAEKSANYQAAAQRRLEEHKGRQEPAAAGEDEAWKYVQKN